MRERGREGSAGYLSGLHEAAPPPVPQSPRLLISEPSGPFCKDSRTRDSQTSFLANRFLYQRHPCMESAPLLFHLWNPGSSTTLPPTAPHPPPHRGTPAPACVCELTGNHRTRAFLSAVMKPFNHIQIGYCSGGK